MTERRTPHSEPAGYWFRCGNCGYFAAGALLSDFLAEWRDHMQHNHRHTTWHLPRTGTCVEESNG